MPRLLYSTYFRYNNYFKTNCKLSFCQNSSASASAPSLQPETEAEAEADHYISLRQRLKRKIAWLDPNLPSFQPSPSPRLCHLHCILIPDASGVARDYVALPFSASTHHGLVFRMHQRIPAVFRKFLFLHSEQKLGHRQLRPGLTLTCFSFSIPPATLLRSP